MSQRILCVDDDEHVLAGFQRHLRRRFILDVAASGAPALRLVDESGPYAVVMADMRMPGMDGIALLSAVAERSPDTVRIMLTGNADQQTAIDAVNKGRIFRFLSKPCPPDALVAVLEEGLQQYRMVTAERELLERTLNGSVALLTDVLTLMEPEACGRGRLLRVTMGRFAEALGVASRWDLEMAAMLSQLGRVTLPPGLLAKLRDDSALTGAEQDLVTRIPELGSNLLARIPRLEPVARIVLYQDKRFDGAGFPLDDVKGEDLPIGSRILKLVADLDRLEAGGLSRARAWERLLQRKGWYDPGVMATATTCLDLGEPCLAVEMETDRLVRLEDLHTGSLLLEDVLTSEGSLIVKSDTAVTPPLLERLRNFALTVGVRQPIAIRMPAPAPMRDDST